jgi:hypothetical protein
MMNQEQEQQFVNYQPQPVEIWHKHSLPVEVTDFQMNFGSMVSFMVKWAIASIPAFIILFIFAMFAMAILGGFFKAMTLR